MDKKDFAGSPVGYMVPDPVKRDDRPLAHCALPGCSMTTSHRGGYCCADHCRKHKELDRARREQAQAK